MTIDQMKMILCVAETMSVSQAAQRLFISQPALSKSIQAAERELGQPIFERTNFGVQPTDYGRIFLATAKKIVDSYECVKSLTVEQIQWDFPILRVSTCPLRHAGWVFHEVTRKYAMSASELRFVSSSSSECIRAVTRGESDVGLISVALPCKEQILAELDKEDLRYEAVTQMDPLIVVSADSPLTKLDGDTVPLRALKRMMLFSIYEDMPVLERMNEVILEILGLATAQQTIYYDPRAGLSDLLRPNEFRCNLDAAYIYQKTGTTMTLLENARTFHLDPVPFQFEIGVLRRKDAEYNPLVEEYICRFKEVFCQRSL